MRFLPFILDPNYKAVLEYMRPPKPSRADLWWIFAGIGLAVSAFVAMEIVARIVRTHRRKRRSEEDFNQLTLVSQLTPEEIRLLRHFLGVCHIKYPDRVFVQFELFNRCLEEQGPDTSGHLSETDAAKLRLVRNKIFFGERSAVSPLGSTHDLKSHQWLHLKRIADGAMFMAPLVEAGVSGLLVATPRVGGKYLDVSAGEHFEIFLWRDNDASYRFETTAIGQSGTRSLITIFAHVDDIERVQRREYHRIATSVAVSAVPVTRDELDKVGRGEEVDTKGHPGLRAYLIDISAAGFALAARTALRPDDLVYVDLPVEAESITVPLIGKVLNVTKRQTTDEFIMHAEFAGLGPDEQERVFQFVYSQAKHQAVPAA